MEASTFTKNREDYAIYTQRYQAAVESVNNQARRRRRDDFTSPANVMGENYLKPSTT
jgi:lysozyme family protein